MIGTKNATIVVGFLILGYLAMAEETEIVLLKDDKFGQQPVIGDSPVKGLTIEEIGGYPPNLIHFKKRSSMQKRKNEFIRFGKRGGLSFEPVFQKRKNEFIRFG
uniref:Uncharacterized protein n=1 Tax=Rhabditophanes sp. KR3021 TaxID=114890 RepID=A0AC35UCX7_9BILA